MFKKGNIVQVQGSHKIPSQLATVVKPVVVSGQRGYVVQYSNGVKDQVHESMVFDASGILGRTDNPRGVLLFSETTQADAGKNVYYQKLKPGKAEILSVASGKSIEWSHKERAYVFTGSKKPVGVTVSKRNAAYKTQARKKAGSFDKAAKTLKLSKKKLDAARSAIMDQQVDLTDREMSQIRSVAPGLFSSTPPKPQKPSPSGQAMGDAEIQANLMAVLAEYNHHGQDIAEIRDLASIIGSTPENVGRQLRMMGLSVKKGYMDGRRKVGRHVDIDTMPSMLAYLEVMQSEPEPSRKKSTKKKSSSKKSTKSSGTEKAKALSADILMEAANHPSIPAEAVDAGASVSSAIIKDRSIPAAEKPDVIKAAVPAAIEAAADAVDESSASSSLDDADAAIMAGFAQLLKSAQ